ncbi:MAG: endo alpha-1,4 polygalactosaminidase [Chloroflexi bacterium]|nr:endo alpha-1,4 polygalactosaminidase [Chloroflexota bacterium]
MRWQPLFIVLALCACSPATNELASPTEATGPTSTSTARANATNDAEGWWTPEPGLSWQIQFTEELYTSYDVDVYFLDLFDTAAEVVAFLHQEDRRAVCYISAGTWEDWRADAGEFPDALLGDAYPEWEGERWLDIRELDALGPLMEARLDLCAAKGFDGVDADNVDGWTNETGFDLSRADALAYTRRLAEQAHARGLGIGLKNAPELAEALAGTFDWMLVESCFAQGWCADTAPFSAAGKAVLAIEYVEEDVDFGAVCEEAVELGISSILKELELGAWVEFCD